jgi:hypothetical protein
MARKKPTTKVKPQRAKKPGKPTQAKKPAGSKPVPGPPSDFSKNVKKKAVKKGNLKHPRRAKPAKPGIIFSRPSHFPKVKDKLDKKLLDGIDKLGELLKDASLRKSSKWKVKPGVADTVWVVHVKYNGLWSYELLMDVFDEARKRKLIHPDHFAFASFYYEDIDDDGNVESEGWFAPSGATKMGDLLERLAFECDADNDGSFAARYGKNSRLKHVVFSIGSRLIRPAFLDRED